jgi:hypothetical protein
VKVRLALAIVLSMMARPERDSAYAASMPAASALCGALAQAVDSAGGGGGPVFVASYRPGADEQALPPALATSAFVYDDALTAIALVACGDITRAQRIGDAFVLVGRDDRAFRDGRLRNAYRSGAVGQGSPALPGWWDAAAKVWAEDAYQDGTATGNVAWAALALLTLSDATGREEYLSGAKRLIDWVDVNTGRGKASGFSGGFFGFDRAQTPLHWASTEHNVDVAAAAQWLFKRTHNNHFADIAARARRFIASAFRSEDGHFLLGTKSDGAPRLAGMALDVQLWPWMAFPDAPTEWRRALRFAEDHLAVDDGFDFNGDRDGVWVEGTAQAALAYRILNNTARADQLLTSLQGDRSPSGLLNATRTDRLTTGLSIRPDSSQPDFFYFRRPHLAPTAWACLAAVGWNPFTGARVHEGD